MFMSNKRIEQRLTAGSHYDYKAEFFGYQTESQLRMSVYQNELQLA